MQNVTLSAPVSFSPTALEELKRIQREDSSVQGKLLRVGTKGGGCSGLTYVLEFDEKKENDAVYHLDGMDILINPSHLIYLRGISIDWAKGLNARGFKFNNPNATATCGCGTSFAV